MHLVILVFVVICHEVGCDGNAATLFHLAQWLCKIMWWLLDWGKHLFIMLQLNFGLPFCCSCQEPTLLDTKLPLGELINHLLLIEYRCVLDGELLVWDCLGNRFKQRSQNTNRDAGMDCKQQNSSLIEKSKQLLRNEFDPFSSSSMLLSSWDA